jgi:hypothetical protein
MGNYPQDLAYVMLLPRITTVQIFIPVVDFKFHTRTYLI